MGIIVKQNPARSGPALVDALPRPKLAPAPEQRLVWAPVARAISSATNSVWGWLPVLSLTGALGLVMVAIGDTAARTALPWAQPLFWCGLLALFLPIAFRLAITNTTAQEAVGLVTVLGLGLYIVKILQSPLGFVLHDEFLHWRTLDDIVTTGRVVLDNPLLPASPLYPGLELATAALTSLTGLSYYASGLIIVGAARLVFILVLYLTYRQLSASSRVAGVACVIYMGNPNFVFFDAVFSYESLALTFLMVVLFAAVRSQHIPGKDRMGLIGLLVLTQGALVMSHHITSYMLLAFLILWLLADYYADYYKGRGSRDAHGPAWLAPLALVVTVAWLILMAGSTVGYLGPHIWSAFTELTSIMQQQESGRQLFVSATGQSAPIWDRLTGFAGVGLLMLALPFGLWQIWRTRHGLSTIAVALAAIALFYPASLAFRLTSAGWEASNRSSEFIYLGLAFVVALGICEFLLPPRGGRWRLAVFGAAAGVIFMGGIIVGWPPDWLLPGPYMLDANTAGGMRDISPQGLQTAAWADQHLGPGNHIGADETNMLLLGSFGRQHIETTLSGGINADWILYAPDLTNDQESLLRKGRVQYMAVDRRLVSVPEFAMQYYPTASIGASLAKFDYLQDVSRIFDNGAIALYDVGAISGVR